mgnify:CR=1 FL=1
MLRTLICLLWFISSKSFGYSQEAPAHHLFNTTILDPYEHQVGITGNYKLGLNEDWEIGTQGLLGLTRTANLYLRHRMFEVGDFRTAFTSHLSYFSMDDAKGMLGLMSINTSTNWGDHSVITAGIMDIIALSAQDNFFTEELAKTSIFFGTASLDSYFNPTWSFNAAAMVPLYGNIELATDSMDVKSETFFILRPADLTSLSWFTFTYTSRSYNLEFGGLGVLSPGQFNIVPYINMFWRFQR